MTFFNKLAVLILIGVMIVTFCCVVKIDFDKEHAEYQRLELIQKYQINDIVYFKLDDRKGIVTNVKLHVRNHDIFYTVRTATDNAIGIDTAAGSGLAGNIQHFSPSAYTDIIVRQGELK